MRTISALLALVICLSFGTLAFADSSEDSEGAVVREEQNYQFLEIHGSAEIQFRSEEGFDDAETQSSTSTYTDLTLDLSLIFTPSDWISTTLALTWEDEDAFDIEEAYLTVGDADVFPLSVSGGMMTLPFGLYETGMASDPLTLEIGETQTQAVMLLMENEGLTATLFLYNGKTIDDDDRSALREWGGDLRYLWEEDEVAILLGTSLIGNIEDSDGLKNYLHDEDLSLKQRVPGISAYAFVKGEQLSFIAEYTTALEKPEFLDVEEVEKQDRPLAWSAEVDYSFQSIAGMETLFAVSYSRSNGLSDLLPEKRLGGTVTIMPYEFLSLAVEYLREYDYSSSSGGTGDHADILTLEVAVEF